MFQVPLITYYFCNALLQQFRASPRMQDMDFPAEFMLPLVEEVYMEEQVENMVLEAKTTIKKYFWVKFIF